MFKHALDQYLVFRVATQTILPASGFSVVRRFRPEQQPARFLHVPKTRRNVSPALLNACRAAAALSKRHTNQSVRRSPNCPVRSRQPAKFQTGYRTLQANFDVFNPSVASGGHCVATTARHSGDLPETTAPYFQLLSEGGSKRNVETSSAL